MQNYYYWIKSIHIIAVISWMAGMLYLPKLYMYHSQVKVGSESDIMLHNMERRLLKIIINPAMIFTYIMGSGLVYVHGIEALGVWFHIKILSVLILSGLHIFFVKCYKAFLNGKNNRSAKFYCLINELVAILMCVAIFMVVLKPFE